ncbi:MAG: DNA methyltransferase, partial [Thermomicrobiales bacterium]
GTRAAANRRNELAALLGGFQDEIASIRVLDPACGSGNFLYVALRRLLNLELEVSRYAANNGLSALFSQVHPRQMLGLEINAYAAELASVVIWIGYLQWLSENAMLGQRTGAILESLDTIRLQDALLDRSDPGHPREAAWPAADVIIGNPPFLGGKRLRAELGDDYTDDLHHVFTKRLPPFSDLVCYFFEKARAQIENDSGHRAGLLATNSIRGGANRRVLERIKRSGDIFMAWDDESWVIDGAAVRISIVGFDSGVENDRLLDGVPVSKINADLSSMADVTTAQRLAENSGICFLGVQLSGPFDMPGDTARMMLSLPTNPNGRPNAEVIKPLVNGMDITRRPRDVWIVDFGVDTPEQDAALFEAPFEYVLEHVKPMRAASRSQARDKRWWLPLWSRPEMRARVAALNRYLATPTVAKHRMFTWFDSHVLPNHQVVVFARDDDYFFG